MDAWCSVPQSLLRVLMRCISELFTKAGRVGSADPQVTAPLHSRVVLCTANPPHRLAVPVGVQINPCG